MRRLVLVFMMLLLPLQWSWAAAASVCAHESGQAHFGHHEHQHAHKHTQGDDGGAQADADADRDTGALADHPDCQACHGVGAACVQSAGERAQAWSRGAALTAYDRFVPEPPVESLLRPPLNLVA